MNVDPELEKMMSGIAELITATGGTVKTLEELIEETMKEMILPQLKERGGVDPMVILWKKGYRARMPPAMAMSAKAWNRGASRELFMLFVRHIIRLMQVDQYMSYSEVWVGRMGEDNKLPSEQPDKWEAVYVIAEDRAGRQISAAYPIIRPSIGEVTLDAPQFREGEDRGRFAHMFDPEEDYVPIGEMIKKAKEEGIS